MYQRLEELPSNISNSILDILFTVDNINRTFEIEINKLKLRDQICLVGEIVKYLDFEEFDYLVRHYFFDNDGLVVSNYGEIDIDESNLDLIDIDESDKDYLFTVNWIKRRQMEFQLLLPKISDEYPDIAIPLNVRRCYDDFVESIDLRLDDNQLKILLKGLKEIEALGLEIKEGEFIKAFKPNRIISPPRFRIILRTKLLRVMLYLDEKIKYPFDKEKKMLDRDYFITKEGNNIDRRLFLQGRSDCKNDLNYYLEKEPIVKNMLDSIFP